MRIRLGIPMNLHEIAIATGGIIHSSLNPTIEYLSTDTREIFPGDLFVAIKGDKYDGDDFVSHAKEKGCLILSSSSKESDIEVKNTTCALLFFSSYYINKLENLKYRIGITGSVGKTTTKEFLRTILSGKYHVHANRGNLNNAIGMSLSILCCPEDCEIMIMEMGMNHRGEISLLSKALRPNIAIITNIGTAHIGNLNSRKAIAEAKLEITDGMKGGSVILPHGEPLLKKAGGRRSFSISNDSADFYLRKGKGKNVKVFHNGFCFCSADFNFNEEHLYKCLAPAVGASILAGVSPVELSQGIMSISGDNTRQTIVSINDIHFYADYYNASFESVKACIEHLKRLSGYSRKSLILGDILELGEYKEEIHRKIGRLIKHTDFHNLFLLGEASEYIGKESVNCGFPAQNVFHFDVDKPHLLAEQIIKNSISEEILLLKASRRIKMERIIENIELLCKEKLCE